MTVRILLFAKARDLAGASVNRVDARRRQRPSPICRRTLAKAIPALEPLLPRLHVAINNDYAADSDRIPAGAEIACFPPVSGGVSGERWAVSPLINPANSSPIPHAISRLTPAAHQLDLKTDGPGNAKHFLALVRLVP